MKADLHTVGIPVRMTHKKPNENQVARFKEWIKSNWKGETDIRVLWHKDYDPDAEVLIVSLATACKELELKCFLVTSPVEIVSGAVYIVISYDNQTVKFLKKLLLSNMVLVIGEKPEINQAFIAEV